MTPDLLSELVLAIVGISLSPILIIAVILVLTTRQAQKNGLYFLSGWLVGLSTLTITLVIMTTLLSSSDQAERVVVSWVRLGLGISLLVLAAKKWLKRPKNNEKVSLPAWMATIDQLTPKKSLSLGAMLGGLNPKNIAFCLVAVSGIVQAEVSVFIQKLLISSFILLSSVTVIGLVMLSVLATDKAVPVLETIKTFMIKHNTTVMVLLFFLFGVLLIKEGLKGI